jgi:hypothetical protein
MSLNARWGGFTIVGPLDPNREEELIGGLRNAMERGQDLGQAKQSYLNAGYSQQEVDSAVRKIGGPNHEMVTADNPSPLPPSPLGGTRVLPTSPRPPSNRKTLWIVLLIIIAILILGGAALLGVFWDKIFK